MSTRFEELKRELEERLEKGFEQRFGTPKKETKTKHRLVTDSTRLRLEKMLDKELKKHDERVEITLSFIHETEEEIKRILADVLAEECFSKIELVNCVIGRGMLIASIYVA